MRPFSPSATLTRSDQAFRNSQERASDASRRVDEMRVDRKLPSIFNMYARCMLSELTSSWRLSQCSLETSCAGSTDKRSRNESTLPSKWLSRQFMEGSRT